MAVLDRVLQKVLEDNRHQDRVALYDRTAIDEKPVWAQSFRIQIAPDSVKNFADRGGALLDILFAGF